VSRNNPWRYNTPPGWNDIRDAPRDGTPIEIQNNWGIAPWFGAHRWVDGKWQSCSDPRLGIASEGPHLSWRPLLGSPAEYVDPTRGRQDTNAYWLMAAGRPDLAMIDETRNKAGVVKRAPFPPSRTGKQGGNHDAPIILLPMLIVVASTFLALVVVWW
jgi:hypothetical protein